MKKFYHPRCIATLFLSALAKYRAAPGLCLIIIVIGSCEWTFAQDSGKIKVTGNVSDSTGFKIPGVTVVNSEDSNVGTLTDNNGNFTISIAAGTQLRLSFVGYQTQVVTVTESTTHFSIILREASSLTDEVVVTAYGVKQTKEALVGSVTTVKPANLKIPASNLTNALAGQVAGVIAYNTTGQPGQDNAQFFIRGVTTFGYKKDPLILIDNVELTASDLARLNVDDIESFSILKDASATSLYGARGGNGVILVRTKSGKTGKAQVNVRFETSSSEPTRSLEIADPIAYMRLFNEATQTRYPLNPLPYTQNKINNTMATVNQAPGSNEYVYPAVDWLDMLFKKRTTTQRVNMNVSGGGGVARYYIAGSFSNDNGILKTDIRNNNNNNVKFQNYQLRSNINIDLTPKTELVVRMAGTFNDYNGPRTKNASFSTDIYNMALHTSPVDFPAFFPPDLANAQTNHILFGNQPGSDGTGSTKYVNPYAYLLSGHQNFSESRMSAQLELNQNLDFLTKGLNFRSILSTNRYSYFTSSMEYKPFYYNAADYDKQTNTYTLQWINSQPGQAQEYLSYQRDANSDNLQTQVYMQAGFDYSRIFGKYHILSAALIGTRQQHLYSNTYTLQNSLPYRNQTLAGRLTYSFNGKYYLEGNFGLNGSERFSENHRYGFFPTIGVSWVASEEKFWHVFDRVLDRFKVRASFGLVGNDAIGNQRFFYLSDVNLNGGNSATFGTNNGYSRNGVAINSYENRNVTWETSKQTNLGIEFSLLKKVSVIAEIYNNDKYDILQDRASIPSTMGLESGISANLGKVRSRGVDLQIDGKHDFARYLSVGLRGNFTYTTNKYMYYEEPDYPELYRRRYGQPLDRNYCYVAERLFVDDNEVANSPTQIFSTSGVAPKGGDIKYRDLNDDGKIDGADQTFVGNPNVPQIVYGFGMTCTYKNFDLSAFVQGQAKFSLFIDPARTAPFIGSPDSQYPGATQVLKAYADNHWSEENQNLYALYPRLGPDGGVIENNRQNSTWWLRDGSFMRLKSVVLGYTLPVKLSKLMFSKNVRIYFNGLNLFTISPFKLWDSELGGNAFAYPIQKVYNVGINVNF